ncbi:hypothetical protein BC943DRAFT_11171 [Umbelopsis sp. AD052]|nr:hypothetical protein BC943DRAFT_11171 [Umbelopsis sp. AD052]
MNGWDSIDYVLYANVMFGAKTLMSKTTRIHDKYKASSPPYRNVFGWTWPGAINVP